MSLLAPEMLRRDADVTRQDGESVARHDVLTIVAEKPGACASA